MHHDRPTAVAYNRAFSSISDGKVFLCPLSDVKR